MKLSLFPDDVIEHYNLRDKASPDGTVYVKIVKGMYGLPAAGLLAQQLLKKRLAIHGYRHSLLTPGLWKHDTRPICFSLIVDDFGVKYVGKEHADHLISVLRKHYEVNTDWDGKQIGRVSCFHRFGVRRLWRYPWMARRFSRSYWARRPVAGSPYIPLTIFT